MEEKNLQVEFEAAAKPLMDFIRDNFHPHTTVIVTMTTAELVEGSMSYCDDSNVND